MESGVGGGPLLEAAASFRIGRWSFTLTPGGDLGHLTADGREVVRGLQFVVRDDAWGTIHGHREVTVTRSPDALVAELRSAHPFPQGRLDCTARLRVDADTLVYEAHAVASGRVLTNRVGFVVLHALGLAGAPVVLLHTDGTEEPDVFPALVEPHQPFRDLAGIAHPVAPDATDARVRIAFDGDVFETEDQRNWSDASFKTYSRPLDLPFPYPVDAPVRQSVRVTLAGDGARGSAQRADGPAVEVDWSTLRPRVPLGLQLGPEDRAALPSGHGPEAVARLGADHVRVDVVADARGLRGAEVLERLAGVPIEVAVHTVADAGAALDELARRAASCRLADVMVFDLAAPATSPAVVDAVRAAFGDLLTGVPLIVGTDDNFAELNRTRPGAVADEVTFALNPQVHDTADRAVIETAEAIPAMIGTAHTFARAVGVGALSLRPRRNIYRQGDTIDRLGRDSASVDGRQSTDYAAAWFTVTVCALLAAGVSRLTVFELTGPRGVLAGGLADPARHPVGEVFASLAAAERTGAALVDLAGDVAALPLEKPSGRSVLVANLAAAPRTVRVFGRPVDFSPYQTRELVEGTPS